MSSLISINNPIIRIKAVKQLTGVGSSTLYYHVSKGLYPKPIKLGEKMSGWLTSEVLAIQAARVAGQSDDEIKALVQRLSIERTQVTV
ncbi:hypothetical protein GCM10009007_12150 [Formosimonas limnophila]|uniref:AlpA family transcriptional regulator n=1 Tax=Formosimonas limnophila TaxID=1384487 RepID=A0A8J3CMX6_9BURK|nr:AlpA family phage regulatory protein [Formosimonas limnophila]GHA72695.1 hypothetical protein GCM10009007_12150 [Formosimonas limnophila]